MSTLRTLLSQLNPDALIESLIRWLPNLLLAALTAALLYAVYKAIARATQFVLHRAEMDETAVQFILAVERYAIGAVTVITVLGQLGVNVTSIVASLGVAGLTLGLAAQDALSNVIAGLFIFWDRPFVIGDLVEIDGHYGKVTQITMRSTRVVTPDGKMLAIPNSTIVNATVASYTNFPNLRLDIPVTVGANEDLDRLRGLFLSMVADRSELMATPAPEMHVVALNDYNLELSFRVWLENEKDHIRARNGLREDLYVLFRGEGVDMPNETFTINPVELRGQALAG